MREFEHVLAWLRGLAWPCAPPIGISELDVALRQTRQIKAGQQPWHFDPPLDPCARRSYIPNTNRSD